ncbi:MAG: hypothetical protein ACLFS4_00515 [Opitutales bacterium]
MSIPPCLRIPSLLIVAILAFTAPAAEMFGQNSGQGDSEDTLDTSILDRERELWNHMKHDERREFRRAREKVESGESDVRTGKHYAESEPSKLKQDQDISKIRKEGEILIKEGETKIREGQRKMVELLKKADERYEEGSKKALIERRERFTFEVPEADFPETLNSAAKSILSSCWEAGYEHILFESVFILSPNGINQAPDNIRTTIYNKLVKIDSTRYTISTAYNFELRNADEDSGNELLFDFENADLYENKHTALLAVELIVPEAGEEGLFAVRALDLQTLTLIGSSVHRLPDTSSFFKEKNEDGSKDAEKKPSAEEVADSESEAEEEETEEAASNPIIPKRFGLHDDELAIRRFAELDEPYHFAIARHASVDPIRHAVLSALLQHTLLKNSNLLLVDSAFIRRAYAHRENAAALENKKNATLQIQSGDDAYKLYAKAEDHESVVQIGPLVLEAHDDNEQEEEESTE